MQWEKLINYLGENLFNIMNTIILWKFLVKKSIKQILISIIKKAKKLKEKYNTKLDKLQKKYDKAKELEKLETDETTFTVKN